MPGLLTLLRRVELPRWNNSWMIGSRSTASPTAAGTINTRIILMP